MFQIRANLQLPQIDLAGYKTTLSNILETAITEAAFGWVSTAVSLIPVWSGASRATFAALAQDISFSLQGAPKSGAPDRTAEGRNASDGGVVFDRNAGIFSFSYSTTLDHLIFNEDFNANVTKDPKVFAKLLEPGPYNFQELANRQASGVLDRIVYPDPRAFILVTRLSI